MNESVLWVKPVGMAAFFLVGVFVLWLHQRSSKVRRERELAERAVEIEKGVERGVCNERGERLCVVCGEVATSYSVRTGSPWWDIAPFVFLSKLYALPQKYTVIDDPDNPVCTLDRRAAVQRLEQEHARLRAEHSRFNARQEQKVLMLDQGGLLQLVREDREEIKRQIGLRGAMRRMLDSSATMEEHHGRTYVLPPATTDTPIPGEPHDDEHQ